MEKRAVIHADLDAFFASVEVKKRPALRGKPVVVGGRGDPTGRGVVSAASYQAREKGVKSGMPLKRAARLCPECVFLPVDFEAYERESERFLAILRDLSPLVESFGLDEAFVELAPGPSDPFPAAVSAAREIKARVKEELRLSVTLGVGPNKLLAKLATGLGKPDGFFVIEPGKAASVMEDLPVRRLWGVGPKTESRLKKLGIKTIGELSRVPERFLVRNFGPNAGCTLYEHSRGEDTSPVVPFHEQESFSREVTFEEDTGEAYIIKETLYALAEDLVWRLKHEKRLASNVGIKIRYSDFETITRSRTLENPTDSMNDVWGAVLDLVGGVDMTKKVRLVGAKVAGLSSRGG